MREFINKYGIYLIPAAAILAAVALFFHFHNPRNPQVGSNSAFFIDEESNEESLRPATEMPPLPGKDGKPTVVRAVKVSCDGGKTSRIAYLEKYTPDAQAKLKELPADDIQRNSILQNGLLIRLPEPGSPWVPANGADGENIRENVSCPNGATLTIVVPPQH